MQFPTGTNPFTFTDSAPLGSHAADAPIGAQQFVSITTVAPNGQMYLTFVIFAYPGANNAGPAGAPLVPIVEILTQPLGLDPNPWQVLSQTQTSGETSVSLAVPDQFVDYTYTSLGPGLFQIAFQQNSAPFDNQNWSIRFTVTDGVTSPIAQTGLTFTLGAAPDTVAPWIAVPPQPPVNPPAAINYGQTVKWFGNLSLAGPNGTGNGVLRAGSRTHLMVTIGNYGTAPLIVSGIGQPDETNGFTAEFPATPVAIAPGSADSISLQISYFVAISGAEFGTEMTTPVTGFSIISSDQLAAIAGASERTNIVSLFAVAYFRNPI